jgi:hypothetical protein
MTRQRLLADKQHLQAILTNPNASVKDKLDAIISDIQLNITLMRLYERKENQWLLIHHHGSSVSNYIPQTFHPLLNRSIRW